jgi:uncharacterized protein
MTCCGSPPSSDELGEVSHLLAGRIAAFVRTLREASFRIGIGEARDAAALAAAGFAANPGLLRSGLKHLMCARRADWEIFDALFDAFWLGRGARSRVSGSTGNEAAPPDMREMAEAAKGASGGLQDAVERQGEGPGAAQGEGRAEGASAAENMATTDFRRLADATSMEQAQAAAERLARIMRTRLTRRHRADRRGTRLDLRRTIRHSVAHGGVPLELVHRRRRDKPLRLVVMVDASASMGPYTAVFMRFVRGLLQSFDKAEAFVFHTRLAHVSDAMRERDAARALDRLSMMAQGAGGGTRIGESLATFNRWHAARVIDSRTCVMILSDGYETGDAKLLSREMEALARRCRRIVWLNPMMGWEGYAPEAAGIRAVLPHVELHAPANTLESLAALEPYLAKL